jgi:hypothetical protein
MILRLASHLGEESRVISPGFKTTKPQKSKTRPKSKEKEMGKIQGVTVSHQKFIKIELMKINYDPMNLNRGSFSDCKLI